MRATLGYLCRPIFLWQREAKDKEKRKKDWAPVFRPFLFRDKEKAMRKTGAQSPGENKGLVFLGWRLFGFISMASQDLGEERPAHNIFPRLSFSHHCLSLLSPSFLWPLIFFS